MSESTEDPWFKKLLEINSPTGENPPGTDPEPTQTTETKPTKTSIPGEKVPQQPLGDLYEEIAESEAVPPENREGFYKLTRRVKVVGHDTSDPLALLAYVIGITTKISILTPGRVKIEADKVIDNIKSKIEEINKLHDKAAQDLNHLQIKLAAEYTVMCDRTTERTLKTFSDHLTTVDNRARKLYDTFDKMLKEMADIRLSINNDLQNALNVPVRHAQEVDTLLKKVDAVIKSVDERTARTDILFSRTYTTIIITFVVFIFLAYVTGCIQGHFNTSH